MKNCFESIIKNKVIFLVIMQLFSLSQSMQVPPLLLLHLHQVFDSHYFSCPNYDTQPPSAISEDAKS